MGTDPKMFQSGVDIHCWFRDVGWHCDNGGEFDFYFTFIKLCDENVEIRLD